MKVYDPITEFDKACYEVDEFIRMNPIMPYDECLKWLEEQKSIPAKRAA